MQKNSVYCSALHPYAKKQSTDPAGTVFFECKIFLFDLLKMCFNNRNCHHGELEYYSQIGIHSTL